MISDESKPYHISVQDDTQAPKHLLQFHTEIGRKMFASMAKALLLVGSALAMLIASALSSPVPGWLCPDNTPAAYNRFCNTGRRLTEVELGVINRVFNTDKRVVGSTIKRFD